VFGRPDRTATHI